MGQDNSVPEFHAQLLNLLGDSNPMVQRNAALALIRFGDASGIDEIRSMLHPYSVGASQGGVLSERLKPGDAINPGTLLAHIVSAGATEEARSQVPGSINRWLVPDGATVATGEAVLLVDPSEVEVWEALRALYLVGQPQDLATVRTLAQAGDAVPRNIRDQAELTARAIQSRETSKP
jgi:pyruvate/2-oxoglutarate dehydrogenase complex dihydrolipoamide acyltransferase (E2) component